MELSQALGFYFPGTVLCVDDNPRFLDGLRDNLPRTLNIRTETSPRHALEILHQQNCFCSRHLLEPIDASNFDQDFDCPVNVHISKLIDIAHQPARFAEINVLIVDQNMTEMSGIKLCEQLKCHPCKKIMLTAEAGNTLAIEAFNKGLIDHFIEKTDKPELIFHIESAINHLRQRYFQEQSALILGAARIQPNSFLKSGWFLENFNRFLKIFNICEFYLLDTMGSFLGLNQAAQPYWFLVKCKQQMADLIDMAESSDAGSNIILDLKASAKLVYFLTQTEARLPVEQWNNLAYPVTNPLEDFNIAIVKGAIQGFDSKKINPLLNYLAGDDDARSPAQTF